AHAAFPGKNGKIAFGGIYTINPDGTGRTFLVNGNDPAWSPDGRTIAYSVRGSLWLVDADGSHARQILVPPTNATYNEPSWSPDGSKIAFGRECPNCFEAGIWTMNPDGTGQTRLTSTRDDSRPAWSPDGSKIVFARFDCTTGPCAYDLFTMNPDGTGQTNITN